MAREKYKKNNLTQTNDPFTVSISDLMSGLLAVFILALSFFVLNFSKASAQLTQNNVKRAELLNTIQQEMESKGLAVTIDAKHGILRIPEGVLFDVGEADVKEEGQNTIKRLSEVLGNVLVRSEYADSVETVFVEGHTDNVPIENDKYPSNWELSTKRAINTWIFMVNSQPTLNSLLNRNKQPIFSCSGYAESRPIADNGTERGKQENRRIDLRFTMTPPSDDDQKIIKFIRKKLNE